MTAAPNFVQLVPMRTIGIIGGSSDVSTGEYYRLINREINRRLGGHYTGEIVINSMNFAKGNYYLDNFLITEGGRYLGEKAVGLERAGADFIMLACNTWHCAADIFMERVTIPLLHIVDPTAEAIVARKIDTVALLGTSATMEGDFLRARFEKKYGLNVLVPDKEDRIFIDRVIFDELTKGICSPSSKQRYLSIIESLASKDAQGVILGCTEISLLVSQADRPQIPMFDTTELHVRAAVDLALMDS
jgi:aspartate racemase